MFDPEPLGSDWLLRLAAAVGAGALIGLNRDLKHKPAGVRTHGLVALGSALLLLIGAEVSKVEPGGLSRTLQGLVTGIGFIGAGVIVRPASGGDHVRGLTTAATIWICAAFGAGFGIGAWRPTGAAFALTLLLLFFGGPFERAGQRLFAGGAENTTNHPA